MVNKLTKGLVASAVLAALAGCTANEDKAASAQVTLRIMETTDLHSNIMDYDYYQSRTDPTIGLARTAGLIHKAREEVSNIVLVDNGDLLQGSPMGDYMAKNGLNDGDVHPAYKAMNRLDYDVANIGNHEFNYGLDYLYKALSGADFPYINANVYCAADDCWNDVKDGENLFTPYLIQDKVVVDSNGKEHSIKIGYIGFVPPRILTWDKRHLEGRVTAKGIVETAEKFIPEMKAQGADVIIAIPHSGIGSTENPGDPMAPNATFALTNVEGIDAIMFGHSHSIFPHANYADLPNTDVEKGLLNGVAAVMPGRWGDNLGVVDLKLELKGKTWTVTDGRSEARPIYDGAAQKELVSADSGIHKAVEKEHQGTLDFVDQPIGASASEMYSFLTLVQDDPTIQIVADAQIAHVSANLPPELKGIPVLSAASPFKAGGRFSTEADATQYVQVDAGELTFKNAADLYLYPNTMAAVKVTGVEVKDWLECSANQFNQIDPDSSAPQHLINWNEHRTYNFDVIDGVTYKIDVTQPSKFDGDCALVNADASRIVDLTYTDADGTVVRGSDLDNKEFIIVANSYRAFSGKFSGTGAEYVALEFPDTNRDALAAYITAQSKPNNSGGYDSMVDPRADFNWDFKNIETKTKLDVRFETQNSAKADSFIQKNQLREMIKLDETNDLGFAVYKIDLTTSPTK
ncbi:bifunctional 2',3'-cyclic-nucleotide 2'-phosphodiesterase/3'-nucleotidase [Psychromonas ossibalaenae]|uniref:bifunctional 2',3'-cyclic-nucleotide 2'-phosphodiesterase/3'-nucleotidase n=1 Tax=Psychromonas ossibalaenae TaxID=444922 RepID=UPI000381F1F5|nr:bifunctional 2',3'-cyclic-nucleotide 2'-phosphodiesterase/3'-nucleotidase [Psychromonas ossibalaenae]